MNRVVRELNHKWAFSKECAELPQKMPEKWVWVNLPHTWNGIDGQDGGNDYYRGTCWYAKKVLRKELPDTPRVYLEFPAANASADVFFNGRKLAHHDGGYSCFRVDLTGLIQDENLICVAVDNSENERVYPQRADFTFYGGLYRGVNVIGTADVHFDLMHHGGPGIMITPKVEEDGKAGVDIQVWPNRTVEHLHFCYQILDAEGNEVKKLEAASSTVRMELEHAHLWQGREDPYLYTLAATLYVDDEIKDQIRTRFGVRSYRIDPEEGFILNGKPYPLRGVCRHQDRPVIGNALLPEHHREDMDIICELGANTIRLAHYQHSQVFYDLCDERGLVIWAEIPYISSHMPDGRENTISQMQELIIQNYNHPSIVVWGLSNEITMMTPMDEDMLENHRILNDMCHKMDPTRPTTMAAVSMCSIDDEIVHISDVLSYNLYFGWYGGSMDMNGPWMDEFHRKYPDTPIGMSEYGAEALNWHNGNPHQGDYSEDYQARYHEELIKQLYPRKFIWATHVWNMFDFAADARSEGGENGMNHKGLVTFDRKYRKDAFYAYKAWLSKDPFVHIGGKRYVDRTENPTHVTVYSNQPEVELFVNGVSLGKKTAEDHFFRYEVPNEGETCLVAKAGDCSDESVFRRVEKPNPDYIFQETGAILNWQDITEVKGCLSLNNTIAEITATEDGQAVFSKLSARLPERPGRKFSPEEERKMMGSMTLLRFVRVTRLEITREEMLEINERLNQIPCC